MSLNKMFERSRRSAIASMLLVKKRKIGIRGGRVYMKDWKKRKNFNIAESKWKKERKEKPRKFKDAKLKFKKTTLMRVELSDRARNLSDWLWSQSGNVNPSDLLEDIGKCMMAMYYDLYRYINDKKSQMIPVNTGALKRSLLHSLTTNKGDISGGVLLVEIGTHLPYLWWVNEMETTGARPHLRHPPYTKRGGGFTHDKWKASYVPGEDDIHAVKHFLDWIVIEARKRANRIFAERVTSMIFQKYKSTFGWTRWTQAASLFSRVVW